MFHRSVCGAAVAASLCLAGSAFAQEAKYGTAAEARAMLEKAIVAVTADKAKAIDMFNEGEGGFRDRDLQPFCFNKGDGLLVAATVPALIGKDTSANVDKTGKPFGKEIRAAVAANADGKISEISYMFPRPGETEPVQKVSFVTGVGDLGCGVGYYK